MPATAATCAISHPIVPAPMMPMDLMVRAYRGASGAVRRFTQTGAQCSGSTPHTVLSRSDHDVERDAALAARYRQRRLVLLAALLVATVVPIVAMGSWWLWPLLVVPAALAAPLAGATGLMATLLASAIALAAASSGDVATVEAAMGFVAIVVVAALGAAHAGLAEGLGVPWRSRGGAGGPAMAPSAVFDVIAERDCRRAAETGSAVAVAVAAIPRIRALRAVHGDDVLEHLLGACADAVAQVAHGGDLVMEDAPGRYVALVAGGEDAARDLGHRLATALEAVAVRDHDGLRVTAGSVAVGAAAWTSADTGPSSLIERADADLRRDMAADVGRPDEQATGEFRAVAVADAA